MAFSSTVQVLGLVRVAQNTKIKNQKWNHSLRITKTDSHFRDSERVIPFLIFDFCIVCYRGQVPRGPSYTLANCKKMSNVNHVQVLSSHH
jgi:hypothetical protein